MRGPTFSFYLIALGQSPRFRVKIKTIREINLNWTIPNSARISFLRAFYTDRYCLSPKLGDCLMFQREREDSSFAGSNRSLVDDSESSFSQSEISGKLRGKTRSAKCQRSC